MPCNRTNDLFPFVDDQLSESDRILVLGHLDVCDDCRAELVELEQLIARLSQIDPRGIPGWQADVLRQIDRENSRRDRLWHLAVRAFFGVACLALAGAVLWWLFG